MLSLSTTSASAQSGEAKEKPQLYTYVSNWVLPRSKWADMAKNNPASQKVIDAALANGTRGSSRVKAVSWLHCPQR